MQNILKIFVVFVVAFAMTACAPSLHPFFTDENIDFDEGVLGVWINDSGEKCVFTKSDGKHYELLYVEEESARFEAHLIKLGGATFLDIYPKTLGKDNELYAANLVRGHTLVRTTIGKDSLSIAMMDSDWLKRLSDRKQLNLAHGILADGTIVLTAPTPELKAFAVKYADSKEAFGDAEIFRRLKKSE